MNALKEWNPLRRLLFAGAAAASLTPLGLTADVPSVLGIPRPAQAEWIVTDLGDQLEPVAINERGQVVVNATVHNDVRHAFLWQNGKLLDLGTLGGKTSEAADMNDRGQIVGTSETKAIRHSDGGAIKHAFLWQGGKMHDLGALGGNASEAHAINERGWIIGSSFTATGDDHAVLWMNGRIRDLSAAARKWSYLRWSYQTNALNDAGQIVGIGFAKTKNRNGRPLGHGLRWQRGTITDLGALPGWPASDAYGINRGGQIIGYSYRWHTDPEVEDYTTGRAVLWQKGRKRNLGTLPGGGDSWPRDINNKGQIIGISVGPIGWTAFLWQSGKIRDLGSLRRDSMTIPSDINERGQIVGESAYRPFLWQNGKILDLGLLPGNDHGEAVALNERGQIIGSSGKYFTEDHAVLWTRTG